ATLPQTNADPVGVVDDRTQWLVELVRQRCRHLAHGAHPKHVREVSLVLASALLTRGQLCGPRSDARLQLLVEATDLFHGSLPIGDVLTHSDQAEGLVARTFQAS